MKPLCAAVLGLVVVFASAASGADDNAKLVGKWELTKAGGDVPAGTVADFTKDGKINVEVPMDGKNVKFSGTYKFDGKKLEVNLTINEQKAEYKFKVTFKGDDEMTLEDDDKKVDTYKKKK
jgi:uncharacterized protein (TIGR03066 family)